MYKLYENYKIWPIGLTGDCNTRYTHLTLNRRMNGRVFASLFQMVKYSKSLKDDIPMLLFPVNEMLERRLITFMYQQSRKLLMFQATSIIFHVFNITIVFSIS